MKKALVVVAIAVLTCSVATAKVNPSIHDGSIKAPDSTATRVNGTLGSLTITAAQTGPLQVQVNASVTTAGGDGVPSVVTFGGNSYTLNDQVWLYAQIYDSPWAGGCTWWTTNPGPNWCAAEDEYFVNSPTALGSFAVSFTATVPQADNYQTFVLAVAGLTWITPNYNWFRVSQSTASSAVQTIYIDNVQPTPGPTATPDPTAGGTPIPTMNRWGVVAMIVMLVGVAVLLISRRH